MKHLIILSCLAFTTAIHSAQAANLNQIETVKPIKNISLGPRPFYLIDQMDASELKTKLLACSNKKMKPSTFSIGHRGAPMQFPEHTRESYMAAANMGAGIIECDVTFTKDEALVCRHSQCDLATTTNILLIPELAKKCSVPFAPAVFNAETGALIKSATAQCCTSDITLEEFKMLEGKMDASNLSATSVEEFMQGTANWRTDLYSGTGTVMTHKESIELFKQLNVKMTPELKSASVLMPFNTNFSQQQYAKKMLEEYIALGVDPKQVYPQSFDIEDVRYWIKHYPEFAKQTVWLDDVVYKDDAKEALDITAYQSQINNMAAYKAEGIHYIAPPMFTLLELDSSNNVVPSQYAKAANAAGIKLITWTLERSGLLKNHGGWYYQTINDSVNHEGDMFMVLDVLAKQVGIVGMFSDWPATTTYYDNCMN
ncbi:glycerophosphodiester phosphodiesterase family protein [Marinicellulosiphila megalodicopiae]|uniref:glycerophosphodiester phosphodiesterase family protein n=1 Tax=Marinicellulosiphila megalodicopiae TaxID=2724896 RepID=UPI003BB02CD4